MVTALLLFAQAFGVRARSRAFDRTAGTFYRRQKSKKIFTEGNEGNKDSD